MPRNREIDAAEAARVGLCVRCRHAGQQDNPRGSRFWRCLRAESDPRLRRYPPIPVAACFAFEADGSAPEDPAGLEDGG